MPFLRHKSRLFCCVETNKLTRALLSRISIVFSDNSGYWFSFLCAPNTYQNLHKESKKCKIIPDKEAYVFGGNAASRM
jgi:hypothetical protein